MPHRPFPAVLMVCAAALMAACQLSGPQGRTVTAAGVTPNAVTGDPIEVQPLDPPAAAPSVPVAAPQTPQAVAAAPVPAADASPAAPETAPPMPAAAEAGTAPAAAPADAQSAVPTVPPKSEAQLACERKGGTWYRIGKGEKRACVRQTRDSGKRCQRESQCEGVCLARSGTCSPFKPMYGCNDILQDDGARVTLCLE